MIRTKGFLRVGVLIALVGVPLLFLPIPLTAQVTYTYTGNPFTQFNQSYACPPVCRITGSFTMAQPLAPNLPYRTQIFPLSFSFSDGLNVFSNASSLIGPVFLVGTDASGNVIAWFIEFDVRASLTTFTNTHISYTCNAPDCPTRGPFDWTTDIAADGVTVTNFAYVSNSPGTWGQGPAAQSFVYVTNFKSNTVSVFDSSTNALVSTIPVGVNPVGVVVAPSGGLAYVANQTFPGSVSVINTQSNTVSATIPVGPFPTGIAITPNGRFVYVVDGTSPGAVSVIDTTSNRVVATIPEGAFPDWVAITPDGLFAYVTNTFSTPAYISVISTTTNTEVARIPVGRQPAGIAITPNGAFAYLTDVLADNVDVIDLRTNSVLTTIPVGINPGRVSITKDGASAYVSNFNSGTVSVIDTRTNTVTTTVPVGVEPLDVAFTPDGLLAYVANSDFFGGLGSVSVVDTISRTVIATLTAGNVPDGAAATPPPSMPSGCLFSLAPPSQSLGQQGGLGSFKVNAAAGCQWQIAVSANWITIFSPGPPPRGGTLGGTGSRQVVYTVARNNGVGRSGTISVNNLTFTVNQAGGSPAPSCTFTVSPSHGVVDDLGGRISVVVNSRSGCSWTAASNAAWLSVASVASGQGIGTVILQVGSNTNGPRTGTATIAGQTFTVSQGAGACGALDITSHVAVSGSGLTPFWNNNNLYSQTITVTNTSGSPINGPIYLVTIGEPTHFGFPNDSGLFGGGLATHCFSPSGDYLLLLSGGLQPGQSAGIPLVWFTQSFTARISFSTRVLSGTPTH